MFAKKVDEDKGIRLLKEETAAGAQAPGGVKIYRSETDDFVQSKDQGAEIPDRVQWVHHSPFYRAAAAASYLLSFAFTFFYTHLALHATVKNKKILRQCRGGCFLYGNHTQPIGDAFLPVRCVFPKRVYTVISPANLGIPLLGPMLPLLGGLLIPDSTKQMKEFYDGLRYHLKKGRCIVIYPEAHVWPYCTFVRHFPDTSFRFPVLFDRPCFCSTVTYQRRRIGKRPKITIYLDGPFVPDASLKKKDAQRLLHDQIFSCMQTRSEMNDYEYVRYEREETL